jgi:hypothetical protein
LLIPKATRFPPIPGTAARPPGLARLVGWLWLWPRAGVVPSFAGSGDVSMSQNE